jgi:hypothetical protein
MSFIEIQQVDLHEPFGNKFGRWSRRFILSAGGIFLITGLAKITSSFGRAEILDFADPIFGISFRHVMLLVGTLELIISTICLFGECIKIQAGLVAWMASSFAIYHWGRSFIGWHQPCPCFGNNTDLLHIVPATVDLIIKWVLIYLLAGSCFMSFLIWKHK